MPSNLVGAALGGFHVESLLAEGPVGVVYLAAAAGGERVALKVLQRDAAEDDRFRRRFVREAEVAAALHHPHIVPLVAAGEEGGVLYLATQYVDGVDLRDLLRREGPLEPTRAVALIAQVAEALDAAHAAGVVHRDVKPGNILVGAADHAYVCDFGLARHASSARTLTGDLSFAGTIDYVSPEQIEGGRLDARTDVYSLACVLYECLSGARPFDRDSDLAVVFAHLNEPPPRPTATRAELPAALDEVFEKALAKAPDERYASCGDFVAAARAALTGTLRPRRRRGRLVAGVAAAAVALSAAAAFVLGGGSSAGGAPDPRTEITQTAIAGVRLGQLEPFYKSSIPGGWREETLVQSSFAALAFGNAKLTVVFPSSSRPAHILTTWNRAYRTAEGIGPCSTVAEMKRVYGNRIHPTWAGTQPHKVFSYALGKNILFVDQDLKTVTAVVVYKGTRRTHSNSPQAWANYIGAIETPCTSGS